MKEYDVTVFAQRWVATVVKVQADDPEAAQDDALSKVRRDREAFKFTETNSEDLLSHAEVEGDEYDDEEDT